MMKHFLMKHLTLLIVIVVIFGLWFGYQEARHYPYGRESPRFEDIPRLIEYLGHGKPDHRQLALQGLEELLKLPHAPEHIKPDTREEIYRAVSKLQNDKDPGVRRLVIGTLIALDFKHYELFPMLKMSLQDEDYYVRRVALGRIGSMGKEYPEVITILAGFLKNEDRTLQMDAITGLGEIGELAAGIIPDLLSLLETCQVGYFSKNILEALENIAVNEPLGEFISLLEQDDPSPSTQDIRIYLEGITETDTRDDCLLVAINWQPGIEREETVGLVLTLAYNPSRFAASLISISGTFGGYNKYVISAIKDLSQNLEFRMRVLGFCELKGCDGLFLERARYACSILQ